MLAAPRFNTRAAAAARHPCSHHFINHDARKVLTKVLAFAYPGPIDARSADIAPIPGKA